MTIRNQGRCWECYAGLRKTKIKWVYTCKWWDKLGVLNKTHVNYEKCKSKIFKQD